MIKLFRKEPVNRQFWLPLSLGELQISEYAWHCLQAVEMLIALQMHIQGNWGDVEHSEWKKNDIALQRGTEIRSAYRSPRGPTFWIVTDPDRRQTTIMHPAEYDLL